MDTIPAGRSDGSKEMQAAKLKFRTLRNEKNLLLQERNKIFKSLQQSKKLVSKFATDKDEIEKCRGNVKEIRALHNKKNLEIDAVQEKLSAQKKVLDALYAAMKEQDNRDAVPKLLEERKTIKAQVDEKYNAIRVMRSEFKDKNDAYYNYVRAQREAKKKEIIARQELIQAEYEKKMEECNTAHREMNTSQTKRSSHGKKKYQKKKKPSTATNETTATIETKIPARPPPSI